MRIYVTPPFSHHIEKYLQYHQRCFTLYICAIQTWFTYMLSKSLLNVKICSYTLFFRLKSWRRETKTKNKTKHTCFYYLQETSLKILAEKSTIQNISRCLYLFKIYYQTLLDCATTSYLGTRSAMHQKKTY